MYVLILCMFIHTYMCMLSITVCVLAFSEAQWNVIVLCVHNGQIGVVVALQHGQQLKAKAGPPQGKVVSFVIGLQVKYCY